jgi:hypothetical protein
MTIQEINIKFDNVIRELQGNAMGDIMANMGSDALVLIRKRILDTGINAEGQKFKPYSTKPMLSGCKGFLNKQNCPAKTKAGRKELKWAMVGRGTDKMRPLFSIPGGYKEFRDMNLGPGHSSYVDFFFSGRMWMNIKLNLDRTELNNGIATIKATDPNEQIKLNGNVARRGSILKLSRSELAWLQDNLNTKISKFLENNGLK